MHLLFRTFFNFQVIVSLIFYAIAQHDITFCDSLNSLLPKILMLMHYFSDFFASTKL